MFLCATLFLIKKLCWHMIVVFQQHLYLEDCFFIPAGWPDSVETERHQTWEEDLHQSTARNGVQRLRRQGGRLGFYFGHDWDDEYRYTTQIVVAMPMDHGFHPFTIQVFAGKILHGAIPLCVLGEDSDSD